MMNNKQNVVLYNVKSVRSSIAIILKRGKSLFFYVYNLIGQKEIIFFIILYIIKKGGI